MDSLKEWQEGCSLGQEGSSSSQSSAVSENAENPKDIVFLCCFKFKEKKEIKASSGEKEGKIKSD